MSVECNTVVQCALSCFTYDCRQACDLAHAGPTSGPDIQSILDALINGCSTQCAAGEDWSCVGHVSWPTPKATMCEITVEVQDVLSMKALAGEVVRYCGADDPYCSSPLAQHSTDSKGMAELSISLPPNYAIGTLGHYFEVTSPDSGGDAGIEALVPGLFFPGFPQLTEPKYSLIPYNMADLGFITSQIFVTSPSELTAILPAQTKASGFIGAGVIDCNALYTDPAAVKITVTVMSTGAVLTEGKPYGNITIIQNVPPGDATVVATPKSLGKPSSSVPVYVRAGSVTAVILGPTPNP